jgi:ATP-dependent Clp protease ATP-binding subunit ClpA
VSRGHSRTERDALVSDGRRWDAESLFERFTERAREAVVLAQEESRALGHGHIGTEHLLLGLTRVPDGLAAHVMAAFDVRTERVRDAVLTIVPPFDQPIPVQVPFTPGVKRTLETSLREALSHGARNIDTEHLLLGLLRNRSDTGVRILVQELGVDVEGLRDQLIASLPDAPGPRPGDVLGRPHVRMAVPDGLLGPLSGDINTLARDIERIYRRPADTGDLLLMLAATPGTPAARALTKLGIELDDLTGAIDATRTEMASAPPAQTTADALGAIRRRLGLSD